MINGNDLGTDIKDAISAMTSEEKQDLEFVWQTVAGIVADHVNPFLVFLPALENWNIVPVFQNNWENYDIANFSAASYYKDPYGRVFLKGCVKNGGANGIFYLPSGYRPERQEGFAAVENGSFSEISIATTGLVSRLSGGNTQLHLTGISFRV